MEGSGDPRLAKGVAEFNQGLYFECHETLEEVWLEEHGDDRLFYQGLIQVAAGFFKWEQGVPAGAIKLWRAGLEKLDGYPEIYHSVDLAAFVRTVKRNLTEVEAARRDGQAAPALSAPALRLALVDDRIRKEGTNG
jgi:predicted metal-dependent hydrolase